MKYTFDNILFIYVFWILKIFYCLLAHIITLYVVPIKNFVFFQNASTMTFFLSIFSRPFFLKKKKSLKAFLLINRIQRHVLELISQNSPKFHQKNWRRVVTALKPNSASRNVRSWSPPQLFTFVKTSFLCRR